MVLFISEKQDLITLKAQEAWLSVKEYGKHVMVVFRGRVFRIVIERSEARKESFYIGHQFNGSRSVICFKKIDH